MHRYFSLFLSKVVPKAGDFFDDLQNHICIFSGWLRELYGPGFLELFAPQLLSRKVWVSSSISSFSSVILGYVLIGA